MSPVAPEAPELPLRAVFESPTIQELATVIAQVLRESKRHDLTLILDELESNPDA